MESLEPLLRIYEGCARALVGELDDANVIKLHRFSGKVSYITYDGFDKNPHPSLKERMKVSLRSLNIDWFDYSNWEDPFLLLSKSCLVAPEHPKRKLFERFEKAKQNASLELDCDQMRSSEIGLRMKLKNLRVQGHRLVNTP